MTTNPLQWLREGEKILDPIFAPHGYEFQLGALQKGSGGEFAVGQYRKGDQAVELHFRRALGIVNYRIADECLAHKDYMRLLGVADQAAYPGFSNDPLDGFRHLRSDLERFSQSFLTGKDRARFEEFVRKLKEEATRRRHLP